MDVLEAITSRRSIRSYTNDVVAQEDLDKILLAAEAAPVARGLYENMHLTIVTKPEVLEKINKAAAEMMGDPSAVPLYGAPMLIVVSEKKPDPGTENPMWSSGACIVENMALEAVELGVGAVLIWGAIRAVNASEELLRSLELPDGFVPSCAIAIGQTEEEYLPREIPEDRIKKTYLK